MKNVPGSCIVIPLLIKAGATYLECENKAGVIEEEDGLLWPQHLQLNGMMRLADSGSD